MRPRSGLIGTNNAPSFSSAGGVWTLREQEESQRIKAWPVPFPAYISGLQLWLDGSDPLSMYDATSGGSLVAADAGVARWQDKSGNGRHVIQATSGNRPLRRTAVKNGFGCLEFDGTNDLLATSGNFPLTGNLATSVFVVYRKTAAAKGNTFGWGEMAFSLCAFGHYDDNTSNAIAFAGANYFVMSATSNNTWYYMTVIKSAGAVNTTTTTRRNAVSVATSGHSTATPNVSASPFYVGRWANYDIAPFQGNIAEIIVYDTAVSATDRVSVETYLSAKWGI